MNGNNKEIETLSNEMDKSLKSVHHEIEHLETLVAKMSKNMKENEQLGLLLEKEIGNLTSLSHFEKASAATALVKDVAEQEKIQTSQRLNDYQRKYFDIYFEIQRLTSEVNNLKTSITTANDVVVGFDAYVQETNPKCNFKQDQIMACFKDLVQDRYTGYEPETGIFTVPLKGVYLCSLVIDVGSNVKEDLKFNIVCSKRVNGSGEEEITATCRIRHKDNWVYYTGIRIFYKDDQIYVKVGADCKKLQLDSYSHFMCALIKKI